MAREDKIDRLLDYLRGRLKKADAAALEGEMKGDPEMRQLYGLLKELGEESVDSDWGEIDATVRAISSRLVNDYFRKSPDGKAVPGVLIYDSKMLPLPEGVRPASVDIRRLKFRIDEMELMVSLYPVSPEAYELMGQLTGYSGERKLEVVLERGKKKFRAEPDTYQLFHFARVASGSYRLVMKADGEVIADLNIAV